MAISNIKATFSNDIHLILDIVTSPNNYIWRSDLERIEVLEEGKVFIEHTKDGHSTTFTITVFEPTKRYEFDMENKNMKGHWVGHFSRFNGQTVIDFTEDVKVKRLLMKPFVKMYLRKQQANYIKDLRKYLERTQ